jgi:phage shock protein C
MGSIITIIVLAAILIAAHKDGVFKSASNTVLGGVCAGIAQRYSMNIALVRVLAVLLALVTGGFVVVLYLLMWVSLPRR